MNRTLTERWIHRDVDGVTVTLNAPEHRNPLDHATIKELRAAFAQAEVDGLRAFVVTGAGEGFSSGGDLRAYLELYRDRERFEEFLTDFRGLCDDLEASSMVTCAMVNGACVAGGLELALACDLVTISADARIGDGHLASGQIPGAGGSQRLYRAVGALRARRILLTGELFDAQTAAELGLVSVVSPPQRLREDTMDLVATCAHHSPLAYRNAKAMLRVAAESPLAVGLDREIDIVVRYTTESFDATEGLQAFLDRRPPEYRGE